MASLVARAAAFSLKLGSTAELRAFPGRALLGLTLRLVSAVCGSGHSIGYMGSTAINPLQAVLTDLSTRPP